MTERPNILFAIADDWAWPHAGAYGDKTVHTPNFDRLAEEGVLFANAFCAAPTCTASRGAVLTGQSPHRLEEGGNLWSILPAKFGVYPDILEQAGYFVGQTRKGWGPGSVEESGRTRNPAGPAFRSFEEFLAKRPVGRPFCFWFGSHEPHRPYEKGSGIKAGLKMDSVRVPPFLPDAPEVRSDLLDYYAEVQTYDADIGAMLAMLDEQGLSQNTLVVVTGDNGIPFPRAKANLYEAGTHMPLAVRWPARMKGGRTSRELIGFTDFAPTFLQAAGLDVPPEMTGHSFLDILVQGKSRVGREAVFTERERHAAVRKGNVGYPCRAVRTHHFLYIHNFRPDRWPAGDPADSGGSGETEDLAKGAFGDIDGGPTKQYLLEHRDEPGVEPFFMRATAKRPAEELFDLSTDPWTMKNLADNPQYSGVRKRMYSILQNWMEETQDPRARSDDDRWDRYPYYGKKQL